MANRAISVESNSGGRLGRKNQLWHNCLLKRTPFRMQYVMCDQIIVVKKLISSLLISIVVSLDFLWGSFSTFSDEKKETRGDRKRQRDQGLSL